MEFAIPGGLLGARPTQRRLTRRSVGARVSETAESESTSGCLDLRLYGAGLGDLMAGIGMHAQHCEECLAAVVSQKNAKGESGKYSTGKSYEIHRVHGGNFLFVFLQSNLVTG